ncbi:Long-chain-fatty-acid--CoA ligase 3 [Pseudocercospora fuligena]|uniref:Long-chain-fatty-acid--CoA ligase 3 n=1 Tax=Pseudocercospora fuligena TaxID=685502 RepID=A0A8H6RPU1_9PEZI|nr:Long-chain-fatty-acid--CoA ligase 3 [Pseudocercospora fuligena]
MSLASLDRAISNVLADWGITTTILALALAAYLVYPVVFPDEPDTHPLLLARQATASPVRKKGESAVYRSPEVPHGYPLRTGLNVKDPAAPRWAAGKDGDIRDIWREVQKGGKDGGDGKPIPKGLIMSVFGKEELVEHDIDELSKEISTIGNHFKQAGIKKVAIYLPNSVEYLLTIFAASFYGVTPILLPYNLPHPKVYHFLSGTGADALVCAAGNLPLDDLSQTCKNLRLLTWVVEKTSRHMDWNGVPDEAAGRLVVSVWHDVVEDNKATATTELPSNDTGDAPGDIVTVWQPSDPAILPQIVPFTQTNIVAAIAALVTAIPMRQRLSSADLVLPADTFTHSYVLCQTLAALYMHCSVAITSVAAPGVDLQLARRGVAPTVIIASAETMAKLHQQETAGISSGLQRFGKYTQDQTVAAGRMPTDGILFKLLAPKSGSTEPGKLRLILTSHRLGAGSPSLTSTMLSDLRIFTRSRIIYALTTARVAGAIAQTNVFDYRRVDGTEPSHFGVPLGSVEIKYLNPDEKALSSSEPNGKLVVMGPAVAGGEVKLDVQMKMREDGCIVYA